MNHELQTLFEADQQERQNFAEDNANDYAAKVQEIRAHDAQRRQRVTELIAQGVLKVAEDYYHAAMIFQHGETPEEIWQAHQLASTASELGFSSARWLAAASLDRWLMYQGKPQKYGTQIVSDGKRYRLWDVDPTITDEDRAAYNVPPLTELPGYLEEVTRQNPPPSLGDLEGLDVPKWLKDAIKRWNQESDVS